MGGEDTYEYRVEFKDGWAECTGNESIMACSHPKLIGSFLNLDLHTLHVEGSPIRMDCSIDDIKPVLDTDPEMEVVRKDGRYAWFSHVGHLMLTMPNDAEDDEWMEEIALRSLKYYCDSHPDIPVEAEALLDDKIMCVQRLALFVHDDRVSAVIHYTYINDIRRGYQRYDNGRTSFVLNDSNNLHLLHKEPILDHISITNVIAACNDMLDNYELWDDVSLWICKAVKRWMKGHPKLNPYMKTEAAYHASLVPLGVPYILRHTEMDAMVKEALSNYYESSINVICRCNSDHPEMSWCSHEIPTTALRNAKIVGHITGKTYMMELNVLSKDPPSPPPKPVIKTPTKSTARVLSLGDLDIGDLVI